jgi:8-hydroxy-5-deazaflavin:NADPH oxidoreductase
MTSVTIIGAGNMARAIGTRMLAGGAEVQILAPVGEEATKLASELVDGDASVIGGALDEHPTIGEVVILAIPYDGALEWAAGHGTEMDGKIVVDITNPVDWASFDGLVTPPDSSAAEQIAKRLEEGVPVVKGFNTTFAATLRAGQVGGQPLDVLLAGDDAEAKAKVAQLVEAAGMRPIDAGPLRRARQLEAVGFLHMTLQESLNTEYRSAIKFLS